MRRLSVALVFVFVLSGLGHAEDAAEPLGWTAVFRRLEGSERRPWYLALVFHKTPKVVTMILAPAATAGDEGAGIDVERIERSAIGDVHQMAAWAARLGEDAKGWKRPSLRERPPASPHAIGVASFVTGDVHVENAEHGGGVLAVGDFLFVEDVVSSESDGAYCIELIGAENGWHYRPTLAELRGGAGAKIGLRGTSDELQVRVHRGAIEGRTRDGSLLLRTDGAEYAAGPESTFLLTRDEADRLDVRAGTIRIAQDVQNSTIAGGSTVVLQPGGGHAVSPLDEAAWLENLPPARACTRSEALEVVSGAAGVWRGEPLNAQLVLRDDGQWNSYERHTGRSVKKGGMWEPRPGGLLQLTYVWTPHRSKTPRTEIYRYVLDGHVLRRLVPGGPVYLKK